MKGPNLSAWALDHQPGMTFAKKWLIFATNYPLECKDRFLMMNSAMSSARSTLLPPTVSAMPNSRTLWITCASFAVVGIALISSWIVAVVFTPYLAYKLLYKQEKPAGNVMMPPQSFSSGGGRFGVCVHPLPCRGVR